jgi:hypothetical protein
MPRWNPAGLVLYVIRPGQPRALCSGGSHARRATSTRLNRRNTSQNYYSMTAAFALEISTAVSQQRSYGLSVSCDRQKYTEWPQRKNWGLFFVRPTTTSEARMVADGPSPKGGSAAPRTTRISHLAALNPTPQPADHRPTPTHDNDAATPVSSRFFHAAGCRWPGGRGVRRWAA